MQIDPFFIGLTEKKQHNLCVHPTKPWVVTTDQKEEILIWNYETQQLEHSFSLTNLSIFKKQKKVYDKLSHNLGLTNPQINNNSSVGSSTELNTNLKETNLNEQSNHNASLTERGTSQLQQENKEQTNSQSNSFQQNNGTVTKSTSSPTLNQLSRTKTDPNNTPTDNTKVSTSTDTTMGKINSDSTATYPTNVGLNTGSQTLNSEQGFDQNYDLDSNNKINSSDIVNVFFHDNDSIFWWAKKNCVTNQFLTFQNLLYEQTLSLLIIVTKRFIIFWDYVTQTWSECEIKKYLDKGDITTATIIPIKTWIIFGFSDGTIRIFNYLNRKKIKTIPCVGKEITHFEIFYLNHKQQNRQKSSFKTAENSIDNSNGNSNQLWYNFFSESPIHFLIGSEDGTLNYWSYTNGAVVLTLLHQSKGINFVCKSSLKSSKLLLIYTKDKSFSLIDYSKKPQPKITATFKSKRNYHSVIPFISFDLHFLGIDNKGELILLTLLNNTFYEQPLLNISEFLGKEKEEYNVNKKKKKKKKYPVVNITKFLTHPLKKETCFLATSSGIIGINFNSFQKLNRSFAVTKGWSRTTSSFHNSQKSKGKQSIQTTHGKSYLIFSLRKKLKIITIRGSPKEFSSKKNIFFNQDNDFIDLPYNTLINAGAEFQVSGCDKYFSVFYKKKKEYYVYRISDKNLIEKGRTIGFAWNQNITASTFAIIIPPNKNSNNRKNNNKNNNKNKAGNTDRDKPRSKSGIFKRKTVLKKNVNHNLNKKINNDNTNKNSNNSKNGNNNSKNNKKKKSTQSNNSDENKMKLVIKKIEPNGEILPEKVHEIGFKKNIKKIWSGLFLGIEFESKEENQFAKDFLFSSKNQKLKKKKLKKKKKMSQRELEREKEIKNLILNYEILTPLKKKATLPMSFQFYNWDLIQPISSKFPLFEDISFDPAGGFCLINYGINGGMVFDLQGQFNLLYTIPFPIESSLWYNGTLFIVTGDSILSYFLHQREIGQIEIASFQPSRVIKNDLPQQNLKKFSSVEKYKQGIGNFENYRPRNTISLVTIIEDQLCFFDQQYNMHLLSLDYPLMKFRLTLQAGLVGQAVKWASWVSHALHSEIAFTLEKRGFALESLQLKGLSIRTKILICCRNHLLKQGEQFLTQVELELQSKDFDLIEKNLLEKAIIRFAKIAWKKKKFLNVAEKAFKLASKFNTLNHEYLAMLYKKSGQRDKLIELYNQIKNSNKNSLFVTGALLGGQPLLRALMLHKNYPFAGSLVTHQNVPKQNQQTVLQIWNQNLTKIKQGEKAQIQLD
ncbi:tset complex member tstf [Anaeramoeba flamelloides]|uniref:Tset complex member tstf n=1 Tax=Anaeramoeba flamelloides TaxID=1746091 RepID=A0AAV7ZB76_9EUKA|nr:tset complex member tstf [Anaeramoeba flamelloides]